MSEEKKINDQQESGSPEQLSLNDDRRVKGLSPEEVFRQTAQNARAVYQL